MATRIGEYVVRGTFHHIRKRLTLVRVELMGWEYPVMVDLFGDPDPDLQGREFYFEATAWADGMRVTRDAKGLTLAAQQVGTTGTMTANRQVRVFPCTVEEYMRRRKLGEPPPLEWKRELYLEWYGSNGRVVLSLVDPVLRTIDGYKEDGELILSDFPPADPPLWDANHPPETSSPGITKVELDTETGEASIEDVCLEKEDENDDPFGLFPNDLHEQLAQENRKRTAEWKETDDIIAEQELMDEVMEGRHRGTSLGEILGKTPHWESLSEEKAEELLKILISRLALYNMTLDVCEHVSMREAYRILTEELVNDSDVQPSLVGTGWIFHMCTHDFCQACDDEAERKFQEMEARGRENESGDEGSA